jgi:hypothetical protein
LAAKKCRKGERKKTEIGSFQSNATKKLLSPISNRAKRRLRSIPVAFLKSETFFSFFGLKKMMKL